MVIVHVSGANVEKKSINHHHFCSDRKYGLELTWLLLIMWRAVHVVDLTVARNLNYVGNLSYSNDNIMTLQYCYNFFTRKDGHESKLGKSKILVHILFIRLRVYFTLTVHILQVHMFLLSMKINNIWYCFDLKTNYSIILLVHSYRPFKISHFLYPSVLYKIKCGSLSTVIRATPVSQ